MDAYESSLRAAIHRYFDSKPHAAGSDFLAAWIESTPEPPGHAKEKAPPRHRAVLEDLLYRAGQMFRVYHEAMDRGDLRPARRFVDPTSYPRLANEAMRAGPSKERSCTLLIRGIVPANRDSIGGMDVWRISITALRDGACPHLICEYWTLWRKSEDLQNLRPGIDRCPNCGAPVDQNDPTRCGYCDTLLADPAVNWVVRSIEKQ